MIQNGVELDLGHTSILGEAAVHFLLREIPDRKVVGRSMVEGREGEREGGRKSGNEKW